MKKFILTLNVMVFVSVATWAQSWNYVGSQGFSGGLAEHVSIAVDSSGTPYMTYSSHLDGFAATVKKFNGTTWKTVGVSGMTSSIWSATVNRSSGRGCRSSAGAGKPSTWQRLKTALTNGTHGATWSLPVCSARAASSSGVRHFQ